MFALTPSPVAAPPCVVSGKSRATDRRSLWSDESGATMVLGIFMAAMAVGVLFYLHGVANVVIHRERMQDAADSAAFMSAVVNARAMNILAILNMIMAAFAVVGAAMQIAADIVLGAAIAAGLVCLGCGPWCAYCCEACVDAARHGVDAADAYDTADDVEDVMEDLISVVHGIAVAVREGAPYAARARVVEYGTSEYAPTTYVGIPWPIIGGVAAEEDDTDWPCDERVRTPAHILGAIASAFETHMSEFYAASVIATPFITRTMRARHYCGDMDSFQMVEEDAWLGEGPFQVQAYMMGEPNFRFTRQGVQVASWGRDDTNLSDSLEFANNVSFAQAEYYFEDEDGMEREEWLWHCQWRARMRRYRIGDALPEGLGSVAGALDMISGLVAH
ncbi:MAG: hypothetical protein J0L92_00625 [Deltaproteobacteria bacterium]|nr:hypothetical protein [Deltaproteobacteria bacterium]